MMLRRAANGWPAQRWSRSGIAVGAAVLSSCASTGAVEGGSESGGACDLGGPIEVELGDGRAMFTPLDEANPPSAQLGGQGALYVLVSVRVEPPLAPDPQLQLDLRARHAAAGCAGDACEWATIGHWKQSIDASLAQASGAPVETAGVVLVVNMWNPNEAREIDAKISDRCGRTGSAAVTFAVDR